MAVFAAMVVALALSLPLVWFSNWRRMIPRPEKGSDYIKASAAFLGLAVLCAVGAALGVLLLAPLRQYGDGVAAIPGGVIILFALAIAGARRFRSSRLRR